MRNTIFILSHTDGRLSSLNVLEKYFKRKKYKIIRLLHPLDNYSLVQTTLLNEDGVLVKIPRSPKGIRNYLEDLYISIRILKKTKFDLFLGASNFDTLPAIICRKILHKKIQRIIYYPRDYSTNRFNRKILNWIYLFTEKIAIKYSDTVVSNTQRAEKERIKLGLDKRKSLIIANGVSLENPIFIPKNISKTSFIYIGDVSREHGLYDLIESLSPIIKKLVIIGSGNDWNRTVKLAKEKNFKLEIHFKKNREYVLEYLRRFEGFGLAPYNNESDWTYYCSPLKIGEYISTGIPVLMSNRPEISSFVQYESYGISYESLDIKKIKQKIKNFDTDGYELKARKFYNSYNISKVLDKLGL